MLGTCVCVCVRVCVHVRVHVRVHVSVCVAAPGYYSLYSHEMKPE